MATYRNDAGHHVRFFVRTGTGENDVDWYEAAPGKTVEGPEAYREAFAREGLKLMTDAELEQVASHAAPAAAAPPADATPTEDTHEDRYAAARRGAKKEK